MLLKLLLCNIKIDIIKKTLSICIIILLASFFGYIVETIWIFIRHGYIDNRGMHFPLLLGYGLANLFIYLLFGSPNHSKIHPILSLSSNSDEGFIQYFIVVFVVISIAEALLGYTVNYFCNIEWWNYNSIPFHIGQYTSVPTSIGFTICICIFLDNFFVPMLDYLATIDLLKYANIILGLSLIAILDCIHALYYMYKNKKLYIIYSIQLKKPFSKISQLSV